MVRRARQGTSANRSPLIALRRVRLGDEEPTLASRAGSLDGQSVEWPLQLEVPLLDHDCLQCGPLYASGKQAQPGRSKTHRAKGAEFLAVMPDATAYPGGVSIAHGPLKIALDGGETRAEAAAP